MAKTSTGETLPRIVDIEMAENQFYALDAAGHLWVWGYAGENLPLPGSQSNPSLPTRVGQLAAAPGGGCDEALTAPKWHTIWGGGNSAGAVAANGLVYSWGHDTLASDGKSRVAQRCPVLNKAANEVLFEAHPDLYKTAAGDTYRQARTDARYDAIVAAMAAKTLPQGSAALGKRIVDESGCPVRQLGFGARAPRLLLDNGDLYTWAVPADPLLPSTDYGLAFLGRAHDKDAASALFRGRPAKALSGVDQVAAGIGSAQALKTDGTVWGWGRNNYCQAIGRHQKGQSCEAEVAGEVVSRPTQVEGLGEVSELAATQCAAWAIAPDGATWAWGAGLVAGHEFIECVLPAKGHQGPKIYDQTAATAAAPYGAPVTAAATGVLRVL